MSCGTGVVKCECKGDGVLVPCDCGGVLSVSGRGLFADDLVLLSPSAVGLQSLLNDLEQYCG